MKGTNISFFCLTRLSMRSSSLPGGKNSTYVKLITEERAQHTTHDMFGLEKLTAKSAGWRWRDACVLGLEKFGQQVYVLLMPVRRTESQAEPVYFEVLQIPPNYHPQSSRRCRPPQSNRRSFQLPVCSLPNTWQPPVRHKNPPQTPFFHQTSSLPTLLRGSRHDTNSREKIERLRCLFPLGAKTKQTR